MQLVHHHLFTKQMRVMRLKSIAIFSFLLVLLCIFSTHAGYAQKRPGAGTTITGTLLSITGEPIEGASIKEKGTQNGTTSNANGQFSIRLQGNSGVLEVSSLGYITASVTLKNANAVQLSLERSENSMEDIVVVGYGQRKKVNLTGAVATVSSKELQNRPITNIAQALQGQVANLNVTQNSVGGAPSAKPNVNVRGYTGFGVSSGPLIVIDGIPGGDLNSINPIDIESISVLKDAASSAIYGSSAPYGVLLITTKQGKPDRKPAISYSNNLSFSQVINLPKMVNSLDFANIFNEAFVNSGRAPWFDEETIERITAYQAGTLKDETIKDPNYDDWYGSGLGYFTGAGPNKGNGNNDWFDIYFRPWAFSQQHNLGISGGSANSTYYLGAGYVDKEGMYNFMSDSYKRYNLRANISSTLTPWLTVGLRSSLSRELNNTPATYNDATGGNYMHQIARKLPSTPYKNPDGNYSDYSNIGMFTEGGRRTSTDDRSMITGEVVLKPIEGLNITANFTYNGRNFNEDNFNKIVYSTLPSGNKTVMFQTNPNNSLQRSFSRQDYYITNIYASYDRKVGSHNFQVLGGYIRELKAINGLNAGNSLLYSNDIPSLNLTYNPNATVSDNNMRLAIEGFFGRLNYNYKSKILFELNGRYDATSRFLAGSRWNLYPSVSAGYVISKENFWKPIADAVNLLKIRGSWGTLGDQWGDNAAQNQYYPFYPSLGTVAPTATKWIFGSGRQAYVGAPGLVNPLLTWATIESLDLGIDAEFLNHRLSASFDWYRRNAKDFVGPAQALPSVLGTSVPSANNAAMRTNGFELTLQWNDRIGKLNYFAKAVLGDYRSVVLKYPNPTKLVSNWYEGMVIGETWGYETVGLFQSADDVANAPNQTALFAGNWTPGDVQYADINKDGKIDFGNNTLGNSGDLKVIGNATPRYSYGLTLGASMHGFDVSVFLQGVGKRDYWTNSNMYWGMIGGEWQSTVMEQHLDRYTEETPGGFFPKFYMTGEMGKNLRAQTRYMQDASYMRIKNIQLGYTLPAVYSNRIKMNTLRIYLSADNVATFTKMYKAIDPELAQGDAKIYPLQRLFSFGLNLSL